MAHAAKPISSGSTSSRVIPPEEFSLHPWTNNPKLDPRILQTTRPAPLTTKTVFPIRSTSVPAELARRVAKQMEATQEPPKPAPVSPPAPSTTLPPMQPIPTTPSSSPQVTLKAATQATNAQLRTLSSQSSRFSTLLLMHPGTCSSADYTAFCEVMSTCSNQPGVSLWSAYSEQFGAKLTFFQRIRARVICFCVYESGILPMVMDTVTSNALRKVRALWADGNLKTSMRERLPRLLSSISELLARYNKTVDEAKRNAEIGGALQKELPALSNSLASLLLNETNGCMTGVHWIYRKVIARFLPGILQNLAKTGLDKLERDPEPCAAAIANFLSEQMDEFAIKLRSGNTLKTTTPLKGSEVLSKVIPQLLEAAEFTASPRNPLKTENQIWFKQLSNRPKQFFIQQMTPLCENLNGAVQCGFQELIERPAYLEQLMGHILALTATSFDPPSTKPVDQTGAEKHLLTSANALLTVFFKEDPPQQTDPERFDEAIQSLRAIGIAHLKALKNSNHLNGAAEATHSFLTETRKYTARLKPALQTRFNDLLTKPFASAETLREEIALCQQDEWLAESQAIAPKEIQTQKEWFKLPVEARETLMLALRKNAERLASQNQTFRPLLEQVKEAERLHQTIAQHERFFFVWLKQFEKEADAVHANAEGNFQAIEKLRQEGLKLPLDQRHLLNSFLQNSQKMSETFNHMVDATFPKALTAVSNWIQENRSPQERIQNACAAIGSRVFSLIDQFTNASAGSPPPSLFQRACAFLNSRSPAVEPLKSGLKSAVKNFQIGQGERLVEQTYHLITSQSMYRGLTHILLKELVVS